MFWCTNSIFWKSHVFNFIAAHAAVALLLETVERDVESDSAHQNNNLERAVRGAPLLKDIPFEKIVAVVV